MSQYGLLRREQLADGVYLNLIAHDKTKTNHLSICFLSDLCPETAAAGSLLARVLIRGCTKYPTLRDVSRQLDACYGADLDIGVEKYGETHVMSFSCNWLKDRFAYDGMKTTQTMLEMAKQILFYPLLETKQDKLAFKEEYVKSEKENLYDAIAAEINNKASYAKKKMYEHMCKNESFSVSVMGEKETIAPITPDELYAYYVMLLKRAPVEIFFAGSGEEDLAKTLQGFFETISRDVYTLSEPKKDIVREEVTAEETMDINQAHLVLGYRMGMNMKDKNYPAFMVFNAMFGGSVSSRLFSVIRETMHLCYTVNSAPESIKGVMMVYAGIAEENREKAYNGIQEQLKVITMGEFTDKELEDARAVLRNQLQSITDSPATLVSWYLARLICGY